MSLLCIIKDVVDVRRITCEVAEQVSHSVVRSSSHLDPTVEVNSELKDLEDVEIEVCTDVISLIAKVLGLVFSE